MGPADTAHGPCAIPAMHIHTHTHNYIHTPHCECEYIPAPEDTADGPCAIPAIECICCCGMPKLTWVGTTPLPAQTGRGTEGEGEEEGAGESANARAREERAHPHPHPAHSSGVDSETNISRRAMRSQRRGRSRSAEEVHSNTERPLKDGERCGS